MIEYVSSTVEHIRRELSKIIVGQDEPIEQILVALLAEGHALIEGVLKFVPVRGGARMWAGVRTRARRQ